MYDEWALAQIPKENLMRELISSMMYFPGSDDLVRSSTVSKHCGRRGRCNAVDFLHRVYVLTESLSSKLDDKAKPTFDSLAKTGSDFIVRTFDVIESVYPINDDQPPDRDRPLPPRGYDKRSTIPAFDPRRLFEIGEKQLQITAGQLTKIVTGDNGSVTPLSHDLNRSKLFRVSE